MSRTFRRKNFERTCRKRHGSKTGGFYTTWDKVIETGNGHGGYVLYRALTVAEKNQEYWRVHGESKHHNAWSPSRFYRKKYTPRRKHWNRMEMVRYSSDPQNYDPQFLVSDQSCWWDWR